MPNYLLAKDKNTLITPSGYKKDVKKLVSSIVVFPGSLVLYKYGFITIIIIEIFTLKRQLEKHRY